MEFKTIASVATAAVDRLRTSTAEQQELSPVLRERLNNLKKRYPSYNDFSKGINPDMQEYFVDERKTILSDYSTLEMIDMAYGRNKAVEWLVAQLTDLNTFCGIINMRDDQTRKLAKVIYAEHKKTRFSEIMLFLLRFKGGHYGHFYGNVEPIVITCALKDFTDECEQKRQEYINEANLSHMQEQAELRKSVHQRWYDFTHALCEQTEFDAHRRIYSVIYLYDLSLQNKRLRISVTRDQYEMLEGECYPFFSKVFRKFFPGFSIQYRVLNPA